MMFDFERPLYTRQDLNKYNIDRNKFYYIGFKSGNQIKSRPIKILDIYVVRSNSTGSKYLRTDIKWKYIFEVESGFGRKIRKLNFWKSIFRPQKILDEPITEKYEIIFQEDYDMINFYLIAETPEEAEIKCLLQLERNNKLYNISKKIVMAYKELYPNIFLKVLDQTYDKLCNDTNYYRFFNIVDDTRNKNGS